MAIMLLAFPFGMFIKTQRLKPLYFIAALGIPASSLLMIFGVEQGNTNLIKMALTLFGLFFMIVGVSGLPFILRNAKKETHTEAIALNYATWSIAMIAAGVLIFLLSTFLPDFFTEKNNLIAIAFLSLISIYFLIRSGKEEIPEKNMKSGFQFGQYDWPEIIRAAFPTLLIAIGAGLTIPFINLFFFNVFGVDSEQFAILGSVTAAMVAVAAIVVPHIKRRFGYKAITVTQSLAVLALSGLALTEFFAEYQWALYVAILLYFLRQPLMNLAGPMTSEMTMYYVGKNNQEILSAFVSAIWSGSWFFSSIIFGQLRDQGLAYFQIFLITAGLYVIGVVLYALLIRDYYRKMV